MPHGIEGLIMKIKGKVRPIEREREVYFFMTLIDGVVGTLCFAIDSIPLTISQYTYALTATYAITITIMTIIMPLSIWFISCNNAYI